MHLAYLILVASAGFCLGESIIEEIPNHNEALADRLALLEKKMMGLEEENKYLRLGFSYGSFLYLALSQSQKKQKLSG